MATRRTMRKMMSRTLKKVLMLLPMMLVYLYSFSLRWHLKTKITARIMILTTMM